MDTDKVAIVISIVNFLLLIFALIRLLRLDRIRKEFFASGLKKNLEQILIDQNRGITQINQRLDAIEGHSKQQDAQALSHFKKLGFVRFNHYDNEGGNLSFSLALLNEHKNGFVVTSHHGREGNRVYSKLINNSASESTLTEEEMQAIEEAK